MNETKQKLTFIGRVIHVGEVQTRGAKGYQFRQLVIEEDAEQYPQRMLVECGGKRLGVADGIAVGMTVKAHVNTSAREYNGRWYGGMDLWKIETASDGLAEPDDYTPTPFAPPSAPYPAPAAPPAKPAEVTDDLPF